MYTLAIWLEMMPSDMILYGLLESQECHQLYWFLNDAQRISLDIVWLGLPDVTNKKILDAQEHLYFRWTMKKFLLQLHFPMYFGTYLLFILH